ncbi:MAG: hypothetical protein GF315_10125 [candidate division Zixibacteria bacterium]|nr:hypothetical protein [candidate division Zixibacteria bacterium]
MMQTNYRIPASHTKFDHRNYLANFIVNHTGTVRSTVIVIQPNIQQVFGEGTSTYYHSQTFDDIRLLYKESFVKKLEKAIQEAEEDSYEHIETIDQLIDLLNNSSAQAEI